MQAFAITLADAEGQGKEGRKAAYSSFFGVPADAKYSI